MHLLCLLMLDSTLCSKIHFKSLILFASFPLDLRGEKTVNLKEMTLLEFYKIFVGRGNKRSLSGQRVFISLFS